MCPESRDSLDDDCLLHANGIDATTGLPAASPMAPEDVISRALSSPHPFEAGRSGELVDNTRRTRGLPLALARKTNDPTAVGWAVVFGSDVSNEVRAAVEPLIAHRRNHTRIPEKLLKVFEMPLGSSLDDWLRKIRAHPSDVKPAKLPYFVTLVGGPESIPFEFQAELGLGYAVGRLAFDRPGDYRLYADSVIAYETAVAPPHGREIAFWSTRNRADRATQLSTDCLARPLVEGTPADGDEPAENPIARERRFRSNAFLGDLATRGRLLQCLCESNESARPAFLFTASHGLNWPKGHELQRAQQGALLCQDWPGLGTQPTAEHSLTAADIPEDARAHGLIAFCFACYGAGTPAVDHVLSNSKSAPVPIAEAPFVSALSKRLLAHPGGGALAVIGHVERAWAYSIRPRRLGTSLLPFRNMMGRILKGIPVGLATRDFSDRFASASVRLLNLFTDSASSAKPNATEIAALLVERNDARNYVLLGDPAVRLRVDKMK
jgi:hypothetical protein